MMKHIYNFCAGPAKLPDEVIQSAEKSLYNFDNSGISILSISHRDDRFINLGENIKTKFKNLLNIPKGYSVLLLQGGASQQFAMLPLNLANKKKALYLNSGQWAIKAANEASKFLLVDELKYSPNDLSVQPNNNKESETYDYIHYTDNETIDGLEYQYVPNFHCAPLVADMSSNLLSKEVDISKYSLIYAGAQKNIGAPGVTIVIIKDDILPTKEDIPTIWNYKKNLQANSIYNTPATFSWVLVDEMLNWLISHGGIEKQVGKNKQKADYIYNFIDESVCFNCSIPIPVRSKMNIVFKLKNESLEKLFLEEAQKEGMYGLKGHRSVGGFRASLYNAVSLEDVIALTSFMREFQIKHT